jgi:hypothetical protein
MKKMFLSAALIFGCAASYEANAGVKPWHQVPVSQAPSKQVMVFQPKKYLVYTFDEAVVKAQMFGLSTEPMDGIVIELPMPDGTFREFRVWQSPMMEDEMATRYSDIKTFSAEAVDDSRVTAKLDFTLYGFHAMVYDGEKTSFVDPYDNYHDGYYFAHYKNDETRRFEDKMKCEYKATSDAAPTVPAMNLEAKGLPKPAQRTANGWWRRTYKLALSADHFYCQAATGLGAPTTAQSLSKVTTSMNRINGVYEKEFSIHMTFVAKEDTLIWGVGTGGPNGNDPFSAIDANANACLTKNQTTCDTRIGSANYDIGHVFTTGGGGLSLLGVVCRSGRKAQSVTGSSTPTGDGYDIDYVAHEMGHEFGSEHTFNNNNDGSCGGNAVSGYAYEPGSGSTIMAYAGICDPDDLVLHSQDYFTASSLVQIYSYLISSETCAVNTTTGNKLVTLPAFATTYTIPYKTPFELTSPAAVDSVTDSVTNYCWEQADLGDFGKRFVNTYLSGPIFRSWAPVTSQVRVFPRIGMVLGGVLSNAGTEGNQGEKAPDTARNLKFKLTVRNILHGNGCFLFPDDVVTVSATATTTKKGFKVTSQSTSGLSYAGGSTQTITWDAVGTASAPVSAASVDIYMSIDGGNNWPAYIGTYTNSGTASIPVPNPATTTGTCRFKVKGHGNVFFNVNTANFSVTHTAGLPTVGVSNVATLASETTVYPVPATNVLHVSVGSRDNVKAVIINAMGQSVWQGTINGQSEIEVASWAKGVYHLRLMNAGDNEQAVKSFIVE